MFENIYEKTNPEMFSKLKTIVEQHPKSYSVMISRKQYMNLKTYILNSTKFLNGFDVSLKSRIWYILKNIDTVVRCKTCNKPILKELTKIFVPQFCNSKCANLCPQVRNKIKATSLKKYGTEHPKQCEYIKKKCLNLLHQKYGNSIDNVYQLKSVKNKCKETCLKKFGVDNIMKCDEGLKLYNETMLKKYHVPWLFSAEKFKKHSKEVCLKKYGVENGGASKQAIDKIRKRYTFDNINFDSSWELAFYIWLSDNNIKFEYQPNDILIYHDKNNRQHRYYPDFKVQNRYIEIKGDNHFDENGYPIFNKKYDWKIKYDYMMTINVKIFKKKDIKKYLDYVKMKYGKNFLKKFRNK